MITWKFVGFKFTEAVGAFVLFVCLNKRLDSFVGMNGGIFFCFEVFKFVLNSSDMVCVDEIAKVIE